MNVVTSPLFLCFFMVASSKKCFMWDTLPTCYWKRSDLLRII